MKDQRGFTLIELLIVVSIVAIGATIATTNFQLWMDHNRGVGFQREFYSLFGEARTRAMASSLQHRLLIDQNAETVTLQRGNAASASTGWTNSAPTVRGERGAGINDVACTPALAVPSTFSFVFNPDGEVLVQDNTAATTATPLTQADVHLSAGNTSDRTTIRLFGWTSKARLVHGWI